MMPLIVDGEKERYIKRLENFARKKTQNKALRVNEAYDKITKTENKAYTCSLKENWRQAICRHI